MSRQFGIFLMIGALLWMGLIFVFSDDNGRVSSKQSNGLLVSMKLIDADKLQKQYYNPEVKKLRVMIRKFAHLALYMALGVLVFEGIKSMTSTKSIRYTVLMTFLVTGIYAVIDEIHQYFVPGRAACIQDVLIDLSGVAISVATCLIIRVVAVQLRRSWSRILLSEERSVLEKVSI